MIKPGSLVRLSASFYSLTLNANPLRDFVGIVVKTEAEFYPAVTVSHTPQDRHYVLWGDETYSYEPTRALIEVESDEHIS